MVGESVVFITTAETNEKLALFCSKHAVNSKTWVIKSSSYRDKINQCMTSTRELIRIHNCSAHEELVKIKYQQTKVGKVYTKQY